MQRLCFFHWSPLIQCHVSGSFRTDFKEQLLNLNRDLFTMVAWDPPGYGNSKPRRTWPKDFFERDAEVAINLMSVKIFYASQLIDL